jgi:hypothetical protein
MKCRKTKKSNKEVKFVGIRGGVFRVENFKDNKLFDIKANKKGLGEGGGREGQRDKIHLGQ